MISEKKAVIVRVSPCDEKDYKLLTLVTSARACDDSCKYTNHIHANEEHVWATNAHVLHAIPNIRISAGSYEVIKDKDEIILIKKDRSFSLPKYQGMLKIPATAKRFEINRNDYPDDTICYHIARAGRLIQADFTTALMEYHSIWDMYIVPDELTQPLYFNPANEPDVHVLIMAINESALETTMLDEPIA